MQPEPTVPFVLCVGFGNTTPPSSDTMTWKHQCIENVTSFLFPTKQYVQASQCACSPVSSGHSRDCAVCRRSSLANHARRHPIGGNWEILVSILANIWMLENVRSVSSAGSNERTRHERVYAQNRTSGLDCTISFHRSMYSILSKSPETCMRQIRASRGRSGTSAPALVFSS